MLWHKQTVEVSVIFLHMFVMRLRFRNRCDTGRQMLSLTDLQHLFVSHLVINLRQTSKSLLHTKLRNHYSIPPTEYFEIRKHSYLLPICDFNFDSANVFYETCINNSDDCQLFFRSFLDLFL